jgi:hypothetical protein
MLTMMRCIKVWSMVNAFQHEPFEVTLHCELAEAAVLYQSNAKQLSPRSNPNSPKERLRRRGLLTGADAGAKASALLIGLRLACKRPLHHAVTPQLQRQLVASAPHCIAKRRIVLGRELCESRAQVVLVCEMDHCREPVGRADCSWRLNDAGTPSYAELSVKGRAYSMQRTSY